MLPEEDRKSRQEDMAQQMREQTSASVTTRMDFSTNAYRAASHKRGLYAKEFVRNVSVLRDDTFRHTYRAWLNETGAPMGVQQKLMRHAHISTTMDQYGNASAVAKRKANRPIVQRVLRREMNQQILIQ
jgi:integrase